MAAVWERQLGRVEGKKELIKEAVAKIQRRFEVFDEVETWNPLGQKEIRLKNTPSPTLHLDDGVVDWGAPKRPSFPA